MGPFYLDPSGREGLGTSNEGGRRAAGPVAAGLASRRAPYYGAHVIPISCTQVEVHVFRRRGKRLETLLIRRSPERSLAGVWQPVTGGIERGESAIQAAVREVREETGLRPLRWWALEHMATFYDVAADHMRVVPVFAAEVAWTDAVHLSHEHDRYAYVSLTEAWQRVLWSTQRSALEALADEVLSGSAGGSAREITARIAALVTPSRTERAATRKTRAARPRAKRTTSRRATTRRAR